MELLRTGCVVCRRPGGALCLGCSHRLVSPPVTRVRGIGRVPAAFAYEGTGAEVIRALKFRDGRRIVGPLADLVTPLVVDASGSEVTIGWLPTARSRRRARGFDQAELLARAIGRRLHRPVVPLLRRRRGPAQTGRSRDQREHDVAFEPLRRVVGPVVLVDDVCTTGATIRAADRCLLATGAGPRSYVVAARTP